LIKLPSGFYLAMQLGEIEFMTENSKVLAQLQGTSTCTFNQQNEKTRLKPSTTSKPDAFI